MTWDDFRERLRATLRNVVGVTCYVNATQNLRLGGRMTKSRYQYVLQAVSGDDLAAWADRLMQAMRSGGTPVACAASMKGSRCTLTTCPRTSTA